MTQQNWQQVAFKNSRGLTLAGICHLPNPKEQPMVIMCHGFSGGKEGGGMALQMGEELGAKGYNVLLFDFSGIGASEGLFEHITLTNQIDDLTCAIDWCVGQGIDNIYTLGRSFGGTTVICQAANDSRVSGVCTWAAAASLTEIFPAMVDGPVNDEGDLYALPGADGINYLRQSFFDDLAQYQVPQLAGAIAPRPLLLVQGDSDQVVPPQDAQLIFDGAQEPKQLISIKDGDHQFSNHYPQVWELFFRWLANAKE